MQNKIGKGIKFIEKYKRKVKNNENIHDTFNWILAEDKHLLKRTGLDRKYSELCLMKKNDFDLEEYYDIPTIGRAIQKRFRKYESGEAILTRLVEKDNKQKVRREPMFNPEESKSIDRGAENAIIMRQMKDDTEASKVFEANISNEIYHIIQGAANARPEARFSKLTEMKHKFYEQAWKKGSKIEAFARNRKRNNTEATLKKILDPLRGAPHLQPPKVSQVLDFRSRKSIAGNSYLGDPRYRSEIHNPMRKTTLGTVLGMTPRANLNQSDNFLDVPTLGDHDGQGRKDTHNSNSRGSRVGRPSMFGQNRTGFAADEVFGFNGLGKGGAGIVTRLDSVRDKDSEGEDPGFTGARVSLGYEDMQYGVMRGEGGKKSGFQPKINVNLS